MIDLGDLRRRMVDHDVIRGEAIVLLTAREVYELLAIIDGLHAQIDENDKCCCSIDWDHRCIVHGPDPDEDGEDA